MRSKDCFTRKPESERYVPKPRRIQRITHRSTMDKWEAAAGEDKTDAYILKASGSLKVLEKMLNA